jgi:flap endonuclease-1
LGGVIKSETVSLDALKARTLAVDAYNTLYQFLAIIRQPDGTPLKDGRGRVTSHLSGLLYRTANLAEKGVKLVFVFDGKPPELKAVEIQRRRAVKEAAVVQYEKAISEGRVEEAHKYAQATSSLREQMVADSKRLLDALGVPWVQAPSEGEAQAAVMAARGDVWAAASQDHDCLLFGAPRMVKNLTVTGRRKLPRKDAYVEVQPEVVELKRTLASLAMSREQLVDVGILIGTDFNPDGVKGVGPKTAVKLIQQNGTIEKVIELNKDMNVGPDVNAIRRIFLQPSVRTDYTIQGGKPDADEVVAFLCGEHGFSEDRVRKAVDKMSRAAAAVQSNTLENYFG